MCGYIRIWRTSPTSNHISCFIVLIHFSLKSIIVRIQSRAQNRILVFCLNLDSLEILKKKMTGFSVSLFVSNISNAASYLSPLLESIPLKAIPSQVEKVVTLVSRTGRELQRYDSKGFRQVVGCIPYRYKKQNVDGNDIEEIEVLVISAQKGKGMLFPKGGWEIDESMEEAALRETIEEAGVTGQLEEKLGKWQYKSKRHGMIHHGYMFPLLVSQQLESWPEADIRQRQWVKLSEAREVCQNWWMREALEEFINRKCHPERQIQGNESHTQQNC